MRHSFPGRVREKGGRSAASRTHSNYYHKVGINFGAGLLYIHSVTGIGMSWLLRHSTKKYKGDNGDTQKKLTNDDATNTHPLCVHEIIE